MLDTSFPAWPSYTEEEALAIKRVLLSNKVNYWTGSETRVFEEEFAHFAGTRHAVAVANGTVALDAALLALGIGPGDEVIVTSRTFLASVSSIVLAGARPVFADVCLNSQNICPCTTRHLITPRTKAILCVHLAGWPCDMRGFSELAEQHGLFLIEDCAQAHGAARLGQAVGSLGDIAAWSFCQDKIMSTGGEGGMVTTNNPDLWHKVWSLKDHGKSFDAVYKKQHPPGFRWLHESFGYNWRMLEIQAVIGRIQLKRMPSWHTTRLKHASSIWSAAKRMPGLRVPEVPDGVTHAAYKCYVFVESHRLKGDWTRDRILAEINAQGVPCYSGSCSEVYLERAFDDTDFRPQHRLVNAKHLGETSLMFLVHPTLEDVHIQRTCEVLEQVMRRAAE